MDEFDLIQKYFKRPLKQNQAVELGVGDDAAVLAVNPEQSLVVCADTMVSGVHFFSDTEPLHLGYKLAMVNLSDIAAMGATPVWATLCLTLPVIDEVWLESFASGLYQALDGYDVALVGGDTTKGATTLSLQLGGEVKTGGAITRSGANIGDTVWVSGDLGAAAYALSMLIEQNEGASVDRQQLYAVQQSLERPEARVNLGIALSGIATSCIDVSDGLLADATHICEASNVGIDIQMDSLPIHPSLLEHSEPRKALIFAATGGEDYELLFTTAPDVHEVLLELSAQLDIGITKIGRITDTGVVRCFQGNADVSADYAGNLGFNHFG